VLFRAFSHLATKEHHVQCFKAREQHFRLKFWKHLDARSYQLIKHIKKSDSTLVVLPEITSWLLE